MAHLDGSVSVTHAGVEMVKRSIPKLRKWLQEHIGVSLSKISIESANTARRECVTDSRTAADINCNAAYIAASSIKNRLIPVDWYVKSSRK